jgi:tetratricopeptide (TPR) repeat protein
VRLSSYFLNLNRHGDAKKAVDPIVDTALSSDYQKSLPPIFIALGSYCWILEDFEKALYYLHQAHENAHKNSDWFSYWQSSNFLALVFSYSTQFEESLKYYRICLELSHAVNNTPGISYVNACMGCFVLAFQGDLSAAYRHTLEALRESESCADAHTKAIACSSHGFVCFFKGDFSEAVHFLTEAIKLARKSGHDIWKIWAEFWLAYNFYLSENYKEAEHFFREALLTSKYRKDNPGPWGSSGTLGLQMSKAAGGEAERDFSPSFYSSQKVIPLIEGLYKASIARTLIMSDPESWEETESLLNDAIAADEKYGTRWSLAQDHAALSELHIKRGDRSSARSHLNSAIEIMQECGADGWVEKYRAALSKTAS